MIRDLATALDGHGGISNMEYTAPSSGSLNGTLKVTYADGSNSSFTITNGRGISSITGPTASGLNDTYQINYNDGSNSTYVVKNGKGISSIVETAAVYPSLTNGITVNYNDGSNSSLSVTNGRGISNCEKSSSGLVDTYTFNYNDGSNSTFTVDNGRGISNCEKSTSGLVDTYQFNYNDGSNSEVTVTNGKAITSITDYWGISNSSSTEPLSYSLSVPSITPTDKYLWHYLEIAFNDSNSEETTHAVSGVYGDTGQDWHVWFKWSHTEPDEDSDMKAIPDDWIGIYSGTASTPPTTYDSYTWYEYKGAKGDTGISITSVDYTSSTGLVDTYTITFSDGNTSTFTVTNGSSISSITKTGTSGLVDTYTVTLTNGNETYFTVTNAKSITSVAMISGTHAAGTTDTYRITFNDSDTFDFGVYNGTNGTGAVSTVAGIGVSGDAGDVPLIIGGNAPPTTSTVGQENQFYFDYSNSVLYLCLGEDSGTYIWSGVGATIDSALSTNSTNPVQNAVITNRVGTTTLHTTSTNLSSAVNEIYDITGDGVLSGFSNASSLTEAANELRSDLTDASNVLVQVVIATTDWDTTTRQATKTVTGMTADENIIVSADPSCFAAAQNSLVYCVAQGTNTLVFAYEYEVPTVNITMNVMIGQYIMPTINYAPLASPAFSGTPTVPTAAAGTNTTQAASTAFVNAAMGTLITEVSFGTVDSLSKTVENPNITANHKLLYVECSNPGAFVTLTATPGNGSVTLSGTMISGQTSAVVTRWCVA